MLLFLTLLWNENLRLQLATVLLQVSGADGIWQGVAQQGIVALLLLAALVYRDRMANKREEKLEEKISELEEKLDARNDLFINEQRANINLMHATSLSLEKLNVTITSMQKHGR